MGGRDRADGHFFGRSPEALPVHCAPLAAWAASRVADRPSAGLSDFEPLTWLAKVAVGGFVLETVFVVAQWRSPKDQILKGRMGEPVKGKGFSRWF